MRKVSTVYGAQPKHWVGNGFHVQSLFSHMAGDKVTDPFLMLDYAEPEYFEPNEGTPRGVGQHPHKGFETVTIAYRGEVAHRDSSGGGGVIRQGDVQWMTAGDGIIHEEFHSPEFSRSGGDFGMVQLWVNLPRKDKAAKATYQHLASDDIPVVALDDDAGHVRIMAGQWQKTTGAASTFTPINVWDVVMQSKGQTRLDIPAEHNLLLLIMNGEVNINGSDSANMGQLVTFEKGGDAIELDAGENGATVLLLSGTPINEPIVGYGPFVMNTEGEIRQAILDFNAGKFGQLNN